MSCSQALADLGIKSTILDQGNSPGESWRRMPTMLRLGPWASSKIDNSIPLLKLYNCPSCSEYADYLEDFADRKNLDIRTKHCVRKVTREGTNYLLELANLATVSANLVIDATGYFNNPVIPNWCSSITDPCKIFHYSEFDQATKFLESKKNLKILIVGGRVSAGEILLDINNSTHCISISSRHPIEFENPEWLQLIFAPAFYFFEKHNSKSKKKGSSVRNMQGGKTRKMFTRGLIRNLGPVLGAKRQTIFFQDTKEDFDVIILATGWKASLNFLPKEMLSSKGEPLCQDMQSLVWPNFFFIGFDNLRSYRSRFLRGIRDDAVALAIKIGTEKNIV